MDQDGTDTEVALGPGHILLDGDPAPPPTERGTAAPNFRPMSIVAKRLAEPGFHSVRKYIGLDRDPGDIVFVLSDTVRRRRKKHRLVVEVESLLSSSTKITTRRREDGVVVVENN